MRFFHALDMSAHSIHATTELSDIWDRCRHFRSWRTESSKELMLEKGTRSNAAVGVTGVGVCFLTVHVSGVE